MIIQCRLMFDKTMCIHPLTISLNSDVEIDNISSVSSDVIAVQKAKEQESFNIRIDPCLLGPRCAVWICLPCTHREHVFESDNVLGTHGILVAILVRFRYGVPY